MVDLGMSATNCHSYQVLVSGTKLVICSNDWTSKKMEMPPDDQAWLDTNSYVLQVGHEPMWLQE